MPERKKVLFCVTKSVWGGAQKYVYDLASNLPSDQFEPVVVAGGEGPLVQKLREKNIKTISLPVLQQRSGFFDVVFSSQNLKTIFALAGIIKRERPDILHLNSSKMGGLGAMAAKAVSFAGGHSPLVVFTAHGWGFRENRPLWQRAVIYLASFVSALLHHKIITINTADFKTAQKYIAPSAKLNLIHNGIAPVGFLNRGEARSYLSSRIGRPLKPDTILVGTIAELTANKGLRYLIKALDQVRLRAPALKLNAVIIGEGEEREKLALQIKSHELEDMVFLAGFIQEAGRYLRALDIFVLPSIKEGLPYALMEAMHAGLPAVATSVGGIPDLVEHGQDGLLVAPRDPGGLAKAVVELAREVEKRKLMGGSAEAKISAGFLPEHMVSQTVEVYDC